MSPEEIRALRGEMSREDFAAEIGVTPLTVYRWELPVAEKESRRPQRRLQQRLRDFRGTYPEDVTGRPGSGSVAELAEQLPDSWETTEGDASAQALEGFEYYDDIFNGRWDSAQRRLLEQFSEYSSEPLAGVRAQVAQAMLSFLWRADVQGAWALVAPLLHHPESGSWPASVGVPLHTLAALLHASADGRLFSPGRVNAHVVHAERYMDHRFGEFRAFLRIAELWAAFHLGDAALHDRLRRKSQEDFRTVSSLVAKWSAWEVSSIAAHLSGCVVEAIRFFRELVEATREGGLPANEVRASGYLAMMMLTAAEPRDSVEKIVARANQTALLHRVEPGWHTILLSAACAEIACRSCAFDEARRHVLKGVADAQRCQWAPIELAYTDLRVAYLQGRLPDLTEVEQRYSDYAGGHRRPLAGVVMLFAQGMTALNDRAPENAMAAFRRSAEAEMEIGTAPIFEIYGLALAYYAAVLAGASDQVSLLVRRAERALERAPMFWCDTALRLFKSLNAALEGRVADATQLADAAQAAYVKMGDDAQRLLASRLRAICAVLMEEPDAEERLAQTESLMRAADLAMPGPYRSESIEALKRQMHQHDVRMVQAGGLAVLAQAANRLGTRGISPTQVLDELFERLVEWRKSEVVWLDELPNKGKPVVIRRTSELLPDEYLEFGDGAGRRFRVGLSGLSSEDRLTFQMLVQFASMALEVVVLRGLTNPASTAVKELVPALPGFVAASESSRQLLEEVSRVASSRASVLLLGESGVGKEMVAHAVYKLSTRANRAFITFNCAAVPRELFEGQLFGYRKGAFTGATSNHPGVLRAADGGTLFLDEIGDLPLELQPKLLRFLENGEVFPLGETHPLKVDVRVIAATHRNLTDMVADRSFREDLYYRLAVVPIEIKPLRERREDIVALAQHFLKNLADEPPGLSVDAAQALVRHDWPGNVRELRNVVERTLAYVHGRDMIRAEDLKF